MLRKLQAIIISIMFLGHSLFSQEGLNLDDLKAPTMPSATIIGTQVNEVNKPKSLKEFEVAVLTNYLDSNNNLSLPNSYAIEVQPGMIFRKNFDYNSYISNNLWSNLKYTTAISVSSTTNFLINDSTSTNAMGIGIRTMLLNGKSGKKQSQAYSRSLTEINEVFENVSRASTLFAFYYENPKKYLGIPEEDLSKKLFKKAVLAKIDTARNLETTEKTKFKTILESFFRQLADDLEFKDDLDDKFANYLDTTQVIDFEKFKNDLHEIKTERYGPRLEWNFATGLSFPTNNFNNSIVPRWGTWLNFSYRNEKYEDVIGILLIRYINNNEQFVEKFHPVDSSFYTNDLIDFGGRLAYEKGKFSFEYELIYRINFTKTTIEIGNIKYSRTDNESTFKHMLNINYRISDKIILSYNLGKNFDTVQDNSGNIISGLSLNFGFGKLKPSDFM